MADEANNKPVAPVAAVVNSPVPKPAPAAAPKAKQTDEVQMIEVETTGDFQLYDATTGTLFPFDESVEVKENNPFVVRQLERKQLKKV